MFNFPWLTKVLQNYSCNFFPHTNFNSILIKIRYNFPYCSFPWIHRVLKFEISIFLLLLKFEPILSKQITLSHTVNPRPIYYVLFFIFVLTILFYLRMIYIINFNLFPSKIRLILSILLIVDICEITESFYTRGRFGTSTP